MLKRLALTALILLFASAAYADIPRPERTPAGKKQKAVDAYLSIQLDRGAEEARLIIPRSQLKALRAELDSIGEDDPSAAGVTGSSSRLQMIVSGALLSLAIVFGGIWLARNGRSTRKPAAAAMCLLTVGTLATIVFSNAGPPAAARSITGKMFSPALHVYKFGGGKIKLEVSDTESQPKLIVPDPESTPAE